MNEYEARRARKAARFHQYAENAAERANAAYQAGAQIADMIPMGQPILVGHHSERRARRDQDRIHASMTKTVEETRKAAEWERRATAVEHDTSISRYDPAAATKLQEKISGLEAEQARMKWINAQIRKGTKLDDLGLSEKEAKDLLMAAKYNNVKGYPAYALSNLSGNLRRYRQRLESLS